MAYVDISGFTAMSERLARLGKQGAEEVAEVINSIFGRLLAVAYENGGSLLKFGGDALLLFFTGTSHELRACHAAAGMRRRLREIGRFQTSVGTSTLKMHVGVHSGPFDLFFVGDVFRELVVAGPHASRTVAMESASVAGEIMVSDATAAALPASVVGEARHGGRLLARAPRPPLVDTVVSMSDHADPSLFVPPRLRTFLAGTVEPEHRRAGVAFVRFDGVDEIIEREGPDIAARELDELMRTMQAVTEANDVTYIDNDPEHGGGKFLLASGAPVTSERDGEILLRTVREIVDSGNRLRLRAGVNMAHVFAGPIGPSYRKKYSIMGDAVNLTARLMGHAETGQVIATAPVLQRSRMTFETVPLEPFRVKGKSEPIEAVDVRGLGSKRDATPSRTPLVGREKELQRLLDGLEETRGGRGRFFEVVGEPGLGKSRLLEEFRWRTPDVSFLSVRAEPYEMASPYSGMRDLLRRALGIELDATPDVAGAQLHETVAAAAPDLEPWLPLIAAAVDAEVHQTPEVLNLSDEFKGERLRWAVVAALRSVLPAPTVIAIEDAHWLDNASTELLRALAGELERNAWMLVATRRPAVLDATADLMSDVITLEPLAESEAAELVRVATADLAIAPHVLAALSERAGGNPLFLQELIGAVIAGQGLDDLPDTVEAVIGTRIDGLAPADRALLRHASVLGIAFSTEMLDALMTRTRLDTVDLSVLSTLADFVVEEWPGNWRFRHALIRDVAYEALPYRRRIELHGAAGTAIEEHAGLAADDWADALSLHFHRAADFRRAWRYSVVAGRRALERFAVVQAADYYRLALDAGKRIRDVDRAELAGVAEALGDACERLGSYAEAMTAYRTARTMAAPSPPQLYLKEGVLRLRLGQYAQALRWYTRGLKGNPSEMPTPVGVELGLAYAGVRYYQGRYRECIKWCRRMAEVAESIGDRAGLAHAYSLLYLAHTHLGSDERHHYRELALPLYEEIGDLTGQANVLNNLGIDAYYEGDWDQALSLYERSRQVQEKTGNVIFVADTVNNIAEILSDQGHLDDAERLFKESLATYRATGYAMGEAFAVGNLGRVAARAGRFDDAMHLLEDALRRQRQIGDDRNAAEVEARISEALVFAGRADEAIPRIEETLTKVDRIGGMPVLRALLLRLLGYAFAQAGDADRSRHALEQSILVALAAGAAYEVALCTEGLGRVLKALGDPEAERLLAEAAETFRGLNVISTPSVPVRRLTTAGI